MSFGRRLNTNSGAIIGVATIVLSVCASALPAAITPGVGISRAVAIRTRSVATPPPPAAGARATQDAYGLRLGSRGAGVRTLQSALVRLTYLPSWAVDGVYGTRTWHAVVAFQGWSGLTRDGVAGPRTLAALTHARRPTPWSSAEGIEIHIAQQVMLLVRGGRVQRAIHVSTGMPGWPTPVGHFRVQSRSTLSWSVPFQTWMPLAQYFYDGYAMHEYPEVPAYPASHGCVRISESEASTVWSFGRIGMRVWTTA